ncbi:MAG: hypothetical protein VYD19_08520 [Myxococcota bacterium]|nr:hypothetical protein [Myxococcota bacterium]
MSGLITCQLWRPCWAPLIALSRAIGPRWEGAPPHLAVESAERVAVQLSAFPPIQRFAFQIGLLFLEWGAPIGGWGLRPLSWLSAEEAERRLERMAASRLAPIRLLLMGCKVLVSLHSYSDPRVEARLGFQRQRWRTGRLAFRNQLLVEGDRNSEPEPAQPEPLLDALPHRIGPMDYLSWDAEQLLKAAAALDGDDSSDAGHYVEESR